MGLPEAGQDQKLLEPSRCHQLTAADAAVIPYEVPLVLFFFSATVSIFTGTFEWQIEIPGWQISGPEGRFQAERAE